MNLLKQVQTHFHHALLGLVEDPAPYLAMIKPAQEARFGDYQANCAMSLAKVLRRKPVEVARDIVARLDVEDWLQPPEIAGPGFINLKLRDDWLAEQLGTVAASPRLGIELAQPPRTYVIDYSSPNVAKPMHVGHLRSTIIGDALARLLRFLGHRVISDNHLGDWGTQFGMLLYGYKNFRAEEALKADPVREMARLYVHVRSLMRTGEDEDEAADPVAEAARQETARLHAGEPGNVRLWQMFMPWCLEEIESIYRRLDVHFDHTLGESYYNPQLPEVVRHLQECGLAQESAGAVVIFFDPEQPPALIRKSDGAFTYTTTDLATIRYRMEAWHPDAILYVVDSRQALHFRHLFDAARRWGYDRVELKHISFGSVLGKDRKPIKTREGGAVELGDLLDEAVRRAGDVYQKTRQERLDRGEDVPQLGAEELSQVYKAVGLGAVKYADLSQNRTSDYLFDWEKMLAMDGNTATYMQYVYARIRSIFRKGQVEPEGFRHGAGQPSLAEPQERALAINLLQLSEALAAALDDYRPNAITAYLWDLSKSFNGFYHTCRVLDAPTPDLRRSRLLLCDLTAATLQRCLDLLGIRTVERM